MTVAIRRLTGSDIAPRLDELAALRIRVFAAFPYLYDGDLRYEATYLHEFAAAPDAILVAAFDGDEIVGAATAAPMIHQKALFRSPFEQRGLDVARLFYFGESVLLPAYRGRGVGHAFFDQREGHARSCQASAACFAAVVRAEHHPARPLDHVALDDFWRKRQYAPVRGLQAELAWKEHGDRDETPKLMQFWLRQW